MQPTILSRLRPNDGSLRILSITWNMANKTPSDADVQTILNSITNPVDVIIISAQEEVRGDETSLGKKIVDIAGANAYTASFNTFTEDFGRVSQTIISHHTIQFSNPRKLQHATSAYKFKNKGGLYTSITIAGKHKLHTAAVHLESHDNVARFQETQHITHKLRGTIDSYDALVAYAKTATIFAGDLNTRNKINNEHATAFFDAFGLQSSADLNGQFTYVGKGKKLKNATIGDANKSDSKRPGEKKGGLLDQTLIQGNAVFEQATIIENTETSDHKPVVTRIRIPAITNDFERTKQCLIHEIARLKTQYIPLDRHPHFNHLEEILTNIMESKKEALLDVYKLIQQTNKILEEAENLKQQAIKEENLAYKEMKKYASRSWFGKLFFSDHSPKHTMRAKKLDQLAKETKDSAYRILGWNLTVLQKKELAAPNNTLNAIKIEPAQTTSNNNDDSIDTMPENQQPPSARASSNDNDDIHTMPINPQPSSTRQTSSNSHDSNNTTPANQWSSVTATPFFLTPTNRGQPYTTRNEFFSSHAQSMEEGNDFCQKNNPPATPKNLP